MGTLLKKKPITDAEMQRRREAVYRADHTNALEGLKRRPESDAVFEAFIRGDIEAREIAQKLKAIPFRK